MDTSGGSLTPLQVRLIAILADVSPSWILTGGAALVGVHSAHRSTRDLDLRWPGHVDVRRASQEVEDRLRAAGLTYDVLQTSPTFRRVRVAGSGEVVIIDLLADATPSVEDPAVVEIGRSSVLVDGRHEILTNKLCALLGRTELRDLEDVRALLASGGELERALADAPRKDGGFSPLTLAWVLGGMPVGRLAGAAGWSRDAAEALERFRDELVDRLLELAVPPSEA